MDKWLNNNNVVKVTSFLLALMLWLVVNNDPVSYNAGVGQAQVATRVDQVNLKVKYDERKFLVQAPSTVQVELRGSKDLLAMSSVLSPDTFDVYVDLRNYGSGKHEVPVQYEGVPRGLEVNIQPSQVSVTIEEIKQVQKNVEVKVVGKAKEEGKVGAPIINPKTVTVTVPESKVDEVAFIQGMVSVDEAKEPIDTKVPLRVLNRRGQLVEAAKVSPAMVNVHVPLAFLPSKTVPLTFSTKGTPAEGYKVQSTEVNPKQITLYGPKERLDKISSIALPDVNVDGLSESKMFPVSISLPDTIEKANAMSAEVKVEITEADETAIGPSPAEPEAPEEQKPPANVQDSVELPIHIEGLAEGQTSEIVKPSSGRIALELQGTKEAMEKVDKDKLTASVDVNGKLPGQHTGQVHVANLPPDVKITNQQNLQATVLIKEQADSQSVNS